MLLPAFKGVDAVANLADVATGFVNPRGFVMVWWDLWHSNKSCACITHIGNTNGIPSWDIRRCFLVNHVFNIVHNCGYH
jgi:hypothetical protein